MVVLAAVLGGAPDAAGAPVAAATVTIAPPAGWRADTEGEAFRRARGWVDASARLVQVYTPSARDGFAEVLAIVELPGVFDTTASEGAELARALAGVPGFDTATTESSRDDLPDGTPRLRTSWDHEGVAYRAELVASGTSRTLLVQATLASEAPLYARTFDAASASLQGASPPRLPFDRGAWRLRTIGVAMAAVVVAFALALWRRPFGAGAHAIGRVAAGLCGVGAIVAAIRTPRTLAADEDALRLAGLGSDTLAAEVATWGLGAAVILWIVGVVLARRERPIASAPNRGSFADRSGASLVSVPIIPKVPPRGEGAPVRRHPDGPSQLEPAAPPAVDRE